MLSGEVSRRKQLSGHKAEGELRTLSQTGPPCTWARTASRVSTLLQGHTGSINNDDRRLTARGLNRIKAGLNKVTRIMP